MKTLVTIVGLLFIVYISDHQVSGACGRTVANTDWASCFPGKECPENFLKLDDDLECASYSGDRVCCLMRPTFDLNVVDAPCIIGGVSEDAAAKYRAGIQKLNG